MTLLKVDAGTVESMAQTADMSIAEFAAETRSALTGQSTGQDNFVYQTKIHGNHLQVGRYWNVLKTVQLYSHFLLTVRYRTYSNKRPTLN